MKGSNYPYTALIQKFLNNWKIFAFPILALALFAATPAPAHAWLGIDFADVAEGAAAALASGLLGTILWIFNWVGVLAFALTLTVLTATMDFVLSVAYTPINETPIAGVVIGWSVIRDFSNMLFILILIAIGVGTMLSIDVGGKKIGPALLVPFIIIALLINFTPLLTGLVIDISNIFTKVFFDYALGGVGAFSEANPFSQAGTPIDGLTTDLAKAANYIFLLLIGLVFNLVSSLILLTVSALLVMRVLALWLLVIFSPLAFAAYILPQTKKYFELWWGQFLQWAILPIPIGLFLFLAAAMLDGGVTGCTELSDPKVTEALQGISFCKSITSVMALGIVVVGMMFSISTSAKGSGFIVSRAQSIRQGTQKWAGRTARRGAIVGATQGIPAARRGAGRSAGWLARKSPKPIKNAAAAGAIAYGLPMQQKLSATGRGAQKVANLPGVKQVGGVATKLGKGAIAPAVGAVDTVITKEKEMWKGIKKYDGMKGNFAALRRQANLELLSDNRAKLVDLMATEHADDFAKIDKNEVLALLKSIGFQSGATKNALNIHPDLAGELAVAARKDPAVELKKQVGKVTDKTLETISPSSWANEAFVKEILEQNKLTIKTYEKIGSKNLSAIQNLESSLERIRETVAKDPSGRIDEKKWGEYLSQNTDMAREVREYTNNSPTLRVLAGTEQIEVRDKGGNVIRDRNRQPVTRKVGALHQKPNNNSGGEESSGPTTPPPPPAQ